MKKTKILIQFSVVQEKIEFKSLFFHLMRIPTFQVFFLSPRGKIKLIWNFESGRFLTRKEILILDK